MSTSIGSAYVQIIPTTKGIKNQMTGLLNGPATTAGTEAGGRFSKAFGGKLKTGLNMAKGALLGFGLVAAGALAKGIKDTAAYGDEIDKMSQKLGLSAEAYQKWDYVLKISGTDMASMTTGLKTLTNKFDDAKNGSASAVAAFEKLGISMKDAENMSREELFAKTIEGFQGMADSTERAALANDLFGRSGQNLAPLFNESSASTKELMETAEKYGMVMSDKAVKASAAFQDSMTTLSMTATGLRNRLLGELLPSITQVTDGLAKMFTGDMSGLDDIAAGIGNFALKIIEGIPKLIEIGGRLIFAIMQGLAEKLPELATKGAEMIEKLAEGTDGNMEELMMKAADIIGNFVFALMKSAGILLKAVGKALIKMIATSEWAKQGKWMAQSLAKGIKSAIGKVTEIVKNIVNKVKNFLSFAGLASKVQGVFNKVKEAATKPIEKAKDLIQKAINFIKNLFPLNIGRIFTNLQLPHISVSGGKAPFGIAGKGSLPKFSVNWHAKAMENPYLFSKPTFFGAGERGDEMLYGRAALMRDIAAASGGGRSVNATYNITVSGSTDPAEFADRLVRSLKMQMRTA